MLSPYFKDGKAISPSGKLTASSTDDDWREVAFEATKSDQVKQALAERLGMDKDKSRHTRIDGIIACNDFVADSVIAELTDLAYTGSAADVNPSITISGIMDNIAGKHDLKKKPSPIPSRPRSPMTMMSPPTIPARTNPSTRRMPNGRSSLAMEPMRVPCRAS